MWRLAFVEYNKQVLRIIKKCLWKKLSSVSSNMYLCSLFGQVERDTLADFGGQLSEHVSLETTDHDLAQTLVQLVQVGRTPTVPLSARPKVPIRD